MAEPDIRYEDNHVLVAVKPPNLLSQADDTGDPDLLSELKELIRIRDRKPGGAYLGLVHRLDRPVGGLMVFAKTSKAAARLAEQLRRHDLGRQYVCVTRNSGPDSLQLTDWLLKDGSRNQVSVVPAGLPGAKEARLQARRLDAREGTCLWAVTLQTGRSHQIRVQMAHAGFPLWGDARYGGGKPGQQIALWGWRLAFEHPTTHQILCFTSLPRGGAWESYADALRLAERTEPS